MPPPAGYEPVSVAQGSGGAPPPSTIPAGYEPVSIAQATGGPPATAQPSLASDALKYSPLGAVQGLASMIRTAASGNNPFAGMAEANAKILDKAKDSFQKGNYGEAALHFANYINPLGGAFEDVSQDLADGNYGHAAAKFTGLLSNAAVDPAMNAATSPGAAAAVSKLPGATAAAIKAAAPDVAAGAAKALAGEAVAKIPGAEWPARIAIQYPAIRQIGKGMSKGSEAFSSAMADEPAAAPTAAPAPVPAAAPPAAPGISQPMNSATGGPAQNGALAMNSQGGPAAALPPAPRVIAMPPASMKFDPSFVRGVSAQPATAEGAPAQTTTSPAPPPPAAIDATAERAKLLDDIAQGTFGQKYKSMSLKEQGHVRFIADQVQSGVAPVKPTVIAPQPVPSGAPAPAPPATVQAAPAPVPSPVTPPPPPVATPAPAASAPNVAKQLREEMLRNGATPESITAPEVEEPNPVGIGKEMAARTQKAAKLAKALNDAGISAADARTMTEDHWAMLAKAVGAKAPKGGWVSSATAGETLFNLEKLQAKAATAQ